MLEKGGDIPEDGFCIGNSIESEIFFVSYTYIHWIKDNLPYPKNIDM